MAIENLKIWHWLIIGAAIGALIGYVSTLAAPERDLIMRFPLSAKQFLSMLDQKIDGQPMMRNVVIQPSRERRNFVTGELLFDGRYKAFAFYADVPFNSGTVHADSILAYVRQHSKQPVMYPW